MKFDLTDEIVNCIVFAMEDQGNEYFFDSVDVKTVLVSSIETVQTQEDDRFYSIPTWNSIKGFKLMERFITLLRNPLAREALRSVLFAGKGVFRNFKNVLHEYPEVEKLWHTFKEREMALVVTNWYNTLMESWGLEKIGFEPEETCDLVHDDFVFREASEKQDSETLFTVSEMICQEFEIQYFGEVGQTISQLWQNSFFEKQHHSEFSLIAETIEGEFAGSCTAICCSQETLHTAVLAALYVEPSFRGLGIGKELINQCVNHLKSYGVKWFLVNSIVSTAMAEMLLSFGFTQLGTGFVLEIK